MSLCFCREYSSRDGGQCGGTTVDAVVFSVLEFAVAASKTDPPDVLDRQKCLAALAEQRRSKWFQVCSLSSLHFSVSDISYKISQT